MPMGGGMTTSLDISKITGLSTATLTIAKLVSDEVDTDTLAEKTAGGAGISVSHDLSLSAGKTVSAPTVDAVALLGDSLTEHTAGGAGIAVNDDLELASGVMVEGGSYPNTSSATGSVIAQTMMTGIMPAINIDVVIGTVRRAGTYKVKIYNWVTYASNGYAALYVNGGLQKSATANNAAGTNEDLGDYTFSAGDKLTVQSKTATPTNQTLMVTLCNSDGVA